MLYYYYYDYYYYDFYLLHGMLHDADEVLLAVDPGQHIDVVRPPLDESVPPLSTIYSTSCSCHFFHSSFYSLCVAVEVPPTWSPCR